ncbi:MULTISPECIES: TolC family protein [unclassified Candidatus Frackibacter]|uniref:TolC family protein n=1 Tax=unclassified Candidatus Frackibacter TaxID=2648818 RepID=UPI0008848FB8|nr:MULTISPECIES: TolC family protein [unclassified Candidatus Frackibacter]SDC87695.1 Outer membrane efflux protein [Candidatus Frackibacter sp. WG11]SEN01835.1 Outer membrane efflux protein [Candidatus Frackibacter sp. WG12]SFM10144.1 Outer membrane efflux protein [Candidatus Frackibacter sp. WG13]
MTLPRGRLLVMLVILFAILLFSNSALAQEMTFEEGVHWGLKHNIEIMKMKQNLNQLKRGLKEIKAGSDWQLDTTIKTQVNNFDTDKISDIDSSSDGEDNNFQELDISLSATKDYWSGLSLRSEVYSRNDNLSADSINDAEFQLNVDQNIYPRLPINAEQNYIKRKMDLKEAQVALKDEKNSKIINWTEAYLNLLRLKESYGLANERYKIAQKELDEVMAQKKVGEAGELELLSAKANLKEAQYQLKNTKNNYQQAKKALSNQLGLSNEKSLKLNASSDYLVQLKAIINSSSIKLHDKPRLVELAMDNSVKLLKNKLSKKKAEYELHWSKLEDKPDINLNGNYNSLNQEWSAGINLSYNIFDSGQQELAMKDLNEQIEITNREYQDIVKGLKLEIDKLVTRIEANQNNLEGKELRLEKAKLDKKIGKRQLERGLITQIEFHKKELALQETRINLKEAKDKLLLSKLELIDYIGSKEFWGGK